MNDLLEIVPGVRVAEWVAHANFECGSLARLAEGLRNLLWADSSLFADTEMLMVHVGGGTAGRRTRRLKSSPGSQGFLIRPSGSRPRFWSNLSMYGRSTCPQGTMPPGPATVRSTAIMTMAKAVSNCLC